MQQRMNAKYAISAVSLSVGVFFCGCQTSNQRKGVEQAFRIADMGTVKVVSGYMIVQDLPDTSPISLGSPASEVFQVLGNATGMNLDRWTVPDYLQLNRDGRWPPEDQSTTRYWVTDAAYWRLCKHTDAGTVFQRISVGFYKSIPEVEKDAFAGNPLIEGQDAGWRVSRLKVESADGCRLEDADQAVIRRDRDDDIMHNKSFNGTR